MHPAVFPVVYLAVGLCGFVSFVGFTGTGSIPAADLRVTFPIAGINRLGKGMELRLSGLPTLAILSLMWLGSLL